MPWEFCPLGPIMSISDILCFCVWSTPWISRHSLKIKSLKPIYSQKDPIIYQF